MSLRKLGTAKATDGTSISISVSESDAAFTGKLTKEAFDALMKADPDHFGTYAERSGKPFRFFTPKETRGRGYRQWKSIELALPASIPCNDVEYWLDFYLGGGSLMASKQLQDGRVAYYAEYQCW